ncbi:disulfide bond formation protein B [Pelistega sp. NLN82]|uniref:Disulfide bond formation protein B n=1 Tax=Pelistega ratti TaxID=2652177 RepID=A0A6L9Y5T1_9BURK|nr:disulfide bond formation protein B [Pelistega ratti]NEN75174.1 disulfide bond formation protein B [Pelistega ratti]
MNTTQKILNTIAFICLLALGFALFSQHYLGMYPCAWCVLQRFILLVIAVVCLLSNLFRSTYFIRFFAFLSAGLSLSGVLSAWYQYNVAAKMLSCDMTFADVFMSRWTHLDATVPWLFGIFATCMDAQVSLFGIEYSLWSLGLFVLMTIASLIALFKKNTRHLFH